MKSKIVFTIIGGGSGQSNILRGLKKFDIELNSIVTMADDGGSSGKLRKEMNILPPGDLRNCILALSNIEPDMEKLFQYRFTKGSLKGQNFGNLFLAAMSDIHGDLKKAIAHTTKILAVRGNVYPVTYDYITLSAILKNGNKVVGESKIANEVKKQNSKIDKIYIQPENVKASEDAIDAIRRSDVIIAGPGSLYTSIFPVLIIDGIKKEIEKSNAIKIFITNIMSESGETDDFSPKDFLCELKKYFGTTLFDYFLINNSYIPDNMISKYMKNNQKEIVFSKEDEIVFSKNNVNFIKDDIFCVKNNLIVHDNEKVSLIIKEIFEKVKKKELSYI